MRQGITAILTLFSDFDPTDADAIDRADGDVTATFTDDRIDDAAQAAAACPLDAISVTPADSQRDP